MPLLFAHALSKYYITGPGCAYPLPWCYEDVLLSTPSSPMTPLPPPKTLSSGLHNRRTSQSIGNPGTDLPFYVPLSSTGSRKIRRVVPFSSRLTQEAQSAMLSLLSRLLPAETVMLVEQYWEDPSGRYLDIVSNILELSTTIPYW